MRNYQKLYYKRYYKLLPDGTEKEVTRRECFAPAEEPTPTNPYKQRWYYDPEASYAVRLPRSPLGESLGKRNAADLKKEERVHSGQAKRRDIELDKPVSLEEDGREVYLEIEDENADVQAIIQDRAVLDALISVLDKLTPDERELWELMKARARKQEIAGRFSITLDGVRYRENRLKSIIGSDPVLKGFYTDN
ncbi:MAG: hypothetical protein GX425_15225 [Peptococcaceae bacterium]|nr:hypothetical protein [Peptococcaceae bacterium]